MGTLIPDNDDKNDDDENLKVMMTMMTIDAHQHGNTALHEAAWKGFSQTVTILCKAKVFINIIIVIIVITTIIMIIVITICCICRQISTSRTVVGLPLFTFAAKTGTTKPAGFFSSMDANRT